MPTLNYPVIANTQFVLEFVQLDAQMQLQASYEDQFGKTIETMTQEEWRTEREAREGKVIIRLLVRSGGQHVAFESRVGGMEERQALVKEVTMGAARQLPAWAVTG